MPKITLNGTGIHFEDNGAQNNKPILLISGVGTQLTRWSEKFTNQLVQRGYRVIRMDNRDIGLSDSFDSAGVPDFKAIMAAKAEGQPLPVPYTLDDMAADAAALLDHLGIERAHVVGSSMGGMIVQLLAINHPEKVASLTSIMSTTGHPDLPRATPEAQAVLTGPRVDPTQDREAYLDRSVASARVIGSPGHPEDTALIRAKAAADLDRAYRPDGFARQYAAILAAPHRREQLRALAVPALVIHGVDDPLVRIEGGRDTASSIPNAEMLEVPGMGHNIPEPLYELVIDAIERTAKRA